MARDVVRISGEGWYTCLGKSPPFGGIIIHLNEMRESDRMKEIWGNREFDVFVFGVNGVEDVGVEGRKKGKMKDR